MHGAKIRFTIRFIDRVPYLVRLYVALVSVRVFIVSTEESLTSGENDTLLFFS